jgi:hypothetical protein
MLRNDKKGRKKVLETVDDLNGVTVMEEKKW